MPLSIGCEVVARLDWLNRQIVPQHPQRIACEVRLGQLDGQFERRVPTFAPFALALTATAAAPRKLDSLPGGVIKAEA